MRQFPDLPPQEQWDLIILTQSLQKTDIISATSEVDQRRKLSETSRTTNYRELDSYITDEESYQEQRDTAHNINFGIRHLFRETNNIILDGGCFI